MTQPIPLSPGSLAAPPVRTRWLREPMVIIAVVLATACIISGCSSGPPDAWALAGRLPGCGTAEAGGVPAQNLTRQEVTCTRGEFANIAIATFRSPGRERQWITANGGYALQGNLWAALPGGIGGGSGSDLDTMQHYLGGTITGP